MAVDKDDLNNNAQHILGTYQQTDTLIRSFHALNLIFQITIRLKVRF